MKKSWFHVSSDKKNLLSGLLYFELQKDLKGIFDFSILKRETLEVLEFIKETFNIRKDLIRIYFNGENGFYLTVPSVAIDEIAETNICDALKKIAIYVKEETGVESLKLDIYDIDSFHISFKSKKESTNLYLINISAEMLSKFTYKELINYASEYRDERYYGMVDYMYPDEMNPVIKEVVGAKEEEKYINTWLKDYSNDIKKDEMEESVSRLIKLCDENEAYKGLIEEGQVLYNEIMLMSNKYEGYKRESFIRSAHYGLILTFIDNLYVKHSEYQLLNLNEYSTSKVLCNFVEGKLDLLFYFSNHYFGNEEIGIKVTKELEEATYEELLEFVILIYEYFIYGV